MSCKGDTVSISKSLFDDIDAYIAEHFIEEKYEISQQPVFVEDCEKLTYNKGCDISIPGEEPVLLAEMFAEASVPAVAESEIKPYAPDSSESYPSAAPHKNSRSLESLMDHMGETFSQMLLRLIDERGLKDSYVYKKANIDRRHFSKIRKDADYAPTKKTVLAFAIALELTLDETKDLLMRAGFALSCSSKADVIISYFIERNQYDIFVINEVLYAYEQPILGE